MILGRGQASGKVILFGEHAVVYGRPALAVPVTQVMATAFVEAGMPGAGTVIWAEDLAEEVSLRAAPEDHPLAATARLALERLGLMAPDWRVTVTSTIPIASGMGSGAAVSVAIIRALAHAVSGARSALSVAEISALAYEVEKLHHGTPSGVDNTVIAYGQPVYFVRGQPPQPFAMGEPFTLAIADTGIRSPTKVAVGDVRRAWQREPDRYEALFDRIGVLVDTARQTISGGQPDRLGPLMDENHAVLQEIGVSCPPLDALVSAARLAGARGAKLSGGGRGGNIIALVTDATAPAVSDALIAAGAARVIVTTVGAASAED